MISFLIPVSRKTFINSINSILSKQFCFDKEIILCFNNNELLNEENILLMNELNIKWFINEENWGSSYLKLYNKASMEYVYFLEDDDILLTNFSFLKNQYLKYDYFLGLYYPHKNMSFNDVFSIKKNEYFNICNHSKLFKKYDTPEKLDDFQLGQLLIKKDVIKTIPKSDNKYNDYFLFKDNSGNIKNIKEYFYKQGYDGTNISIIT